MPKSKINKSFFRLGFVNVLLVIIVIILGIILSGSIFGPKFNPPGNQNGNFALQCCDSGNGDACQPQKTGENTFDYKNEKYGLIKSNVKFQEQNSHLRDSGQKFMGNPIIINTSDEFAQHPPAGTPPGFECGNGIQDQLWKAPRPTDPPASWTTEQRIQHNEVIAKLCVPIPNDEVIYVCKKNCSPSPACNPSTTCYGSAASVYDVYFRLKDLPDIPDIIKNCSIPDTAVNSTDKTEPQVVFEGRNSSENLQLQTLKFVQQGLASWYSPFCKPAVYLYPEKTSLISVKVKSSQPFTYTDPLYPIEGWNILVDPNGLISYQNKNYDYLYYETKIDDKILTKPTNGFIVKKDELSELFKTILPKLGLNINESSQFSKYWLSALPTSNYYFVGIVPEAQLSNYSTLDILPNPNSEIRVTLYFESHENKINVQEPVIVTPKRSGFTVVEWGGIYKKHIDEKFSCFL